MIQGDWDSQADIGSRLKKARVGQRKTGRQKNLDDRENYENQDVTGCGHGRLEKPKWPTNTGATRSVQKKSEESRVTQAVDREIRGSWFS